MADLTACYFCGTIEGPLEEHPVIPEEMDPPEADRRTVAVCSSCRGKVATIQAAIVDYLDADPREAMDRDPAPGRTDDPERDGPERPDVVDDRSDEPASQAAGEQREGTEEGGAGKEGNRELPAAARKIVRLLQNREFPVERSEIETVAASAYDLDPGECREAVDALVAEGVLTAEGDELYRPGEAD